MTDFTPTLYKANCITTIRSTFTDWENVFAFQGNLDVLLQPQSQVAIDILDMDMSDSDRYGDYAELPPTNVVNIFGNLKGVAFVVEPADSDDAWDRCKEKAYKLLSLMNGASFVLTSTTTPISATPVFPTVDAGVCAYLVEWSDQVEVDHNVVLPQDVQHAALDIVRWQPTYDGVRAPDIVVGGDG